MENRTKKIIFAAMFSALACVTTMIIRIPTMDGYINLGDGIVLLCGWVLGPAFGFVAAGIGSALADIFGGYALYAPITFIIKGLMALAASYLFKALYKVNKKSTPSRIISGIAAELIMIAGYYLFESIIYGSFITAAKNILFNLAQGTAGLVDGLVLIKIFEKNQIKL